MLLLATGLAGMLATYRLVSGGARPTEVEPPLGAWIATGALLRRQSHGGGFGFMGVVLRPVFYS